jgi:predicted nucleotidyltransferase
MYASRDRDALRHALITASKADERIVSAALTGSAAIDAEDEWSDIDLAFGIADGVERSGVIADWSDRMYREHGAVHHMDVVAPPAVFRVFLLRSTLQVDLAFWPAAELGAIGPTFRLLFGSARERPTAHAATALGILDMGWLYALHARSSIARGRVWQAEYMISGMRDQVLALACLRAGLPTAQGRGVDRLPADVTDRVAGALVRSLEVAELRRAFGVACYALLDGITHVDVDLAHRLGPTLLELADGSA